jgi:hypothetical protein
MNSTATPSIEPPTDVIPPLPPGKGRVFGHPVPRLEDPPLETLRRRLDGVSLVGVGRRDV